MPNPNPKSQIPNPPSPPLAANVRRLMAREGLSAADLVLRGSLDPRTIKAILSGRRDRPHPRTLHKLARGLGVASDELFLPAAGSARARFDRETNPAVREVIASNPRLFTGWLESQFDQLFSQFGAGGGLTRDGALEAARRINEQRAIQEKVALILESDERELLAMIVETLYGRATARPSS